jgi:hypothetical protein
MLDVTWKLRVSQDELESWKATAAHNGVMLSEWVRETLNSECYTPRAVGDVISGNESRKPKASKKVAKSETQHQSVAKSLGIALCECGHRRGLHTDRGDACSGELGMCKCSGWRIVDA